MVYLLGWWVGWLHGNTATAKTIDQPRTRSKGERPCKAGRRRPRVKPLSFALPLLLSHTSSTSVPLSPHCLARSLASLHFSLASIPVSIPFSIHVSSTDPSSARSPDYTRLCNIQPTILYRLYRKLSSHLSRAWLPTRASCIPIYSGAWIEKRAARSREKTGKDRLNSFDDD